MINPGSCCLNLTRSTGHKSPQRRQVAFFNVVSFKTGFWSGPGDAVDAVLTCSQGSPKPTMKKKRHFHHGLWGSLEYFHTMKNRQYLITACDVCVPKIYESFDLPKQDTPRNVCGKYSKCSPNSSYFAIPQAFGCLSSFFRGEKRLRCWQMTWLLDFDQVMNRCSCNPNTI